MKMRNALTLAALAVMPAAAMAQWSDNFDSYASNVNINGQGGWQGWGNTPAAAPITSNAQALSAPNSVFVSGPADNVHQYAGYTSGWWEYKASVYVPTNMTGDAYFILLNKYADPAGPFNWSVEVQLNGTTGLVQEDHVGGVAAPHVRTGTSRPIVRGVWHEIKVDFDLTGNYVQVWYNNQHLASGTWTTNGTSGLSLQAVDLFNNASNGVYFDDLSLTQIPAPGSVAILGLGGLLAARRRRS